MTKIIFSSQRLAQITSHTSAQRCLIGHIKQCSETLNSTSFLHQAHSFSLLSLTQQALLPGCGARHGPGHQPNDSNKSYSDGLTALCGDIAVISFSHLKFRRFVAFLDAEFGDKSSG